MAMNVDQFSIAYFPVPKVACTSLKLAFYKLANGKDFDPQEMQGKTIQQCFRTKEFAALDPAAYKDSWKICLIRDPASRIISAYNNKIGKWARTAGRRPNAKRTPGPLKRMAVSGEEPSLSKFCLNLRQFRRMTSIRHHTAHFTTFLGPDLGFFDRVYRMEELDLLVADVSARAGMTFTIPHTNSSVAVDRTLTEESATALLDYCRQDYDFLADYYEKPTVEALVAGRSSRPSDAPAPTIKVTDNDS